MSWGPGGQVDDESSMSDACGEREELEDTYIVD